MDEIVKNKPIKKMIKNIAIKRIRTKLDIKINENKWLGVELKKKKNKSMKQMIQNKTN
jgi:2-iminoacetate synthase ThiH